MERVRAALSGGVSVVQYRPKGKPREACLDEGGELKRLCRSFGVTFIVNDDVELARDLDADGVHLGQDDGSVAAARELLGPGKIIGKSTHNLDEAIQAEQEGADYIGFGAMYPTGSKAVTHIPGTSGLAAIRDRIRIPVVAIGGIKEHNLPEVVRHGATTVCLVTAIVGATDIAAAVRGLRAILEQAGPLAHPTLNPDHSFPTGDLPMTTPTQMAAARQGLVTKEMRQVLADEPIGEAELLERVAAGTIAIPANRNHTNLRARAIGAGLSTKVNVNLGVSEDCCDIEAEMAKVRLALDLKTDALMDLSTCGDTRGFRRRLIAASPMMIGTVPVYDAVARYGKDVGRISVNDFFDVVRIHAEDGVDFMTIHAG